MSILTKKKSMLEKPRNEQLLSAITPIGVEFRRNDFSLGENYCRIYGVIKYPPETVLGWLSRLTSIPDTIVSVMVRAVDQGGFNQAMSKAITENNVAAESTNDELSRSRYIKASNDAKRIMEDIEMNSEAVAGYGLQIMVLGRERENFLEKCARVESVANALGCRVRIVSHMQKDAYMHLSPTYPDQPKMNDIIERPFLLSTFVGGFPFAKNGLCDNTGYYLGKNSNGSIILYDLWKRTRERTNSNVTIIGDSGMGKSTAVKHIILSEIARGTKVIIIDPEGEYKEICLSKNINGKWIDVAGGRGGLINPLQVRPAPRDDDKEDEEESNNQSAVADLAIHLKTLRTFFSLYLPSLTEKHHAILEKLLIELYKKHKIVWDTDISKLKNEDFPTISDLYTLIKTKLKSAKANVDILTDLELLLSSAAEGADQGLWNGYTTIDSDSCCICLDTKSVTSMGDQVLAAQYFNILTWCWEEISKNKTERVMLVADEVWMMIDPKTPQSLSFLRNAEKRARKYEGSLVVSTQQIVEFLDPQIKLYGQPVLDMPTTKFIFGMSGQGYKETVDLFSLNTAQSKLIESQLRGVALMCVGASKFRIRFDLTPERIKMFGTGGGR